MRFNGMEWGICNTFCYILQCFIHSPCSHPGYKSVSFHFTYNYSINTTDTQQSCCRKHSAKLDSVCLQHFQLVRTRTAGPVSQCPAAQRRHLLTLKWFPSPTLTWYVSPVMLHGGNSCPLRCFVAVFSGDTEQPHCPRTRSITWFNVGPTQRHRVWIPASQRGGVTEDRGGELR